MRIERLWDAASGQRFQIFGSALSDVVVRPLRLKAAAPSRKGTALAYVRVSGVTGSMPT